VLELVDRRQEARARRDWLQADTLREQLAEMGWHMKDTPDGPEIERLTRPAGGQ
jgi:cysteinyl-tRNA synthetase